jgi:phosphoglycolate phosphatase-like HAD superfamily hydrolase
VATGGHGADELQASGADAVFEDLSDTDRFLDLLR